MHSKARCFSLERSRGVEEARQEVKEHGQKNSTLQWGEIFLEGTSILIWIFMCFHKISFNFARCYKISRENTGA